MTDIASIVAKMTPMQVEALKLLAERGTISPDDETLRRPIRCLQSAGLARKHWAKGRMWAIITTQGIAALRALAGEGER